MELLNRIFGGKEAPMHDFGSNESPEYEAAQRKLSECISKLKLNGISETLIFQLEAAENRIVALEIERMFCYAVAYGAKLQRELDNQTSAYQKFIT